MDSPLVQRQIFPPFSIPTTTTTRTVLSETRPPNPTTTSLTTGNGLLPPVTSALGDVSSLLGPISSGSSLPQSSSTLTSSSSSTVPPTSTPLPGPVTVTQTSSGTAPPSSGAPEPRGRTFFENKPLVGVVFGLAGAAVLVIAIVAVTSYVRRRNRKRLLADASNFSFDPRDVEDRASSEEKYSHSGLVGHHSSGHGHSDYTLDNGAANGLTGVGVGGASRPALPPSPSIPAYIPQDYAGHDGGYPAQYHNLSNVPTGYNHPHDMYGPRNGGGYSHSRDPYNPAGSSDLFVTTDPPPPVPRKLQPGLYPAQHSTFTSPSSTSPPPLTRSPTIPSTTSPPPISLRASASKQHNQPRFPTSGTLPDTFGRHDNGGDDAYGGAFLGHGSPPPGPGPLRVANM